MKNFNLKLNLSSWRELPSWLRFIILITLAIGILFRFVNLDKKIYWSDETITSMRVAGYKKSEGNILFNGNIINIDALRKYQRLSPERSWFDTIQAVAQVPEHPPIYYLMARFWSQLFGTSITAMRSFPALISLLVFPSIYWLSWELFKKASVGWIAVALVAVSPFNILYAQEARQYSLWTVTVILSSAAFLRALRLQTFRSWTMYIALMTLALYTHSFSILLAIGQGIYNIFREGWRWSQAWKNYLRAFLAIIIIWFPWLIVFVIKLPGHRQRVAWSEANQSTLELIQRFFLSYTRGLIDFQFSFTSSFIYAVVTGILVFTLVGYSLYVLSKHSQENPNKAWLFLLLLIFIIPLTLLLPDLIIGGRRSTISRYFLPSQIGIHLAIAYLIYCQITLANLRQQNIGKMLIMILLFSGILSSGMNFSADCWWNKSFSCGNIRVAEIVNLAPRPLIISNQSPNNLTQLLSLTYRLKSEVNFLLISQREQLKIPEGFSDLFLYNSSEELKSEIERSSKYKIESVEPGKLIQLDRLVLQK